MIRLQHIYTFWLFHDVILSILDVLQSFYSHFISFLVLTNWHSAKCQFLFFPVYFTSQKINIRRNPNATKLYRDFLWTRRNMLGPGCTWGSPEEGTTHQGAPWWVVPTSGAPRTASLLYKYPKNPRTLEESTKYSSSRRRVQNHQIQSRHHLGWGSLPPLVPLRWCMSSSF